MIKFIKSFFFKPAELIEPSVLEKIGPQNSLKIIGQWRLNKLDELRFDYEKEVKKRGLYSGPRDKWLHINGKYAGQIFKYSGLRSQDCPIGAEKSKHKEGTTFDLKCRHMVVLLYLIKDNWRKYSIKRMENPKVTFYRGWIHVEIDKVGVKLYVFNP